MKISRQRRVRKYLNFYKSHFQFRSPYQVLIDGTFCNEALNCKLNIKEQLPKYLEDQNVKIFTTPCVIAEVELLGPKVFGAMLVAKNFKTRICGHEKNPIAAPDCLLSMVSNKNPDHYLVGTQDRVLTEKLREIPGVPLLYINYNAINLEKPSMVSAVVADEKTKDNLQGPEYQTALVQKLKEETLKSDTIESKKTKKRKAKGPNPLSCKKKSKTAPAPAEKVRKRKRHKRGKKSDLSVVAP